MSIHTHTHTFAVTLSDDAADSDGEVWAICPEGPATHTYARVFVYVTQVFAVTGTC